MKRELKTRPCDTCQKPAAYISVDGAPAPAPHSCPECHIRGRMPHLTTMSAIGTVEGARVPAGLFHAPRNTVNRVGFGAIQAFMERHSQGDFGLVGKLDEATAGVDPEWAILGTDRLAANAAAIALGRGVVFSEFPVGPYQPVVAIATFRGQSYIFDGRDLPPA